MRRSNFGTGLAGVLVGALLVTAMPAVAEIAAPRAEPGDTMRLGRSNIVDANTALRGNTASNLVLRNSGDGVPLNLLTNGNGRPPMKVDSRRLVRNLNADQLDFRDADELIRAAHDSTGNALDASGNLLTATITAPSPGILVMSGSINATGTAEILYTCEMRLDADQIPHTVRTAVVSDAGEGHTRNNEEDCSTDGTAVVDAGTYEVHFATSNVSIGLTFDDAAMWVIWVPFDGAGDIPAP